MKDKKIFCLGCERSFKSTGGLNSHKRFCKNWQDIKHSYQRKHKSLEETKTMCLNGQIKEDRTIGVLLKYILSIKK